jgi:hypothetical protein
MEERDGCNTAGRAQMNKYEWRRFWYRRGSTIHLTDDGYLLDPESEWGRLADDSIKPLASLEPVRCLVLLGEAGIGKSTELRRLRCAARATPPDAVLEIDLGEYGDELSLRRDLFECATFEEWKRGSGQLTMLLDSLDEALIEMPKVAATLKRGLRDAPLKRLWFRIAARTAAWPETLTSELESLFGKPEVELYELAPLRKFDVELAAKSEGLDAQGFLTHVEARGVGPLAANPITFALLVHQFRERSELSTSVVDSYERGLIALCEPNPERRDRNRGLTLSAGQALAVASRIAALTHLAGRTSIFTGREVDSRPSDILECALVGGVETADGSGFDVTAEAVRWAMVESGLFNSRGPNRLGFAHKTYEEYLAARYLHRHRVPEVQLRSLLYVPDEGCLIPQLQEVAVWLASMDERLFEEIAGSEPEVLLRSDAVVREDSVRARLTARLLDRIENEQLAWRQVDGLRGRVRRLAHDGLAKQLQATIIDSKKRADTRAFAVAIAQETDQKRLSQTIAKVALDANEDRDVRVAAARAVVRLEDPSARQMLKPLALGQAGDDQDDQLRGYGLRATWPEFLTVEELLGCITPPKRPNPVAEYDWFLISGSIAEQMEARDLPKALEWAERLKCHGDPLDRLSRVAGQLAYRACECLDDPGVGPAMARLVLKRLHAGTLRVFISTEPPGRARASETETGDVRFEDDRRKELLRVLVAHMESPEEARYLLLCHVNLVHPNDIEWFFQQAARTGGDEARKWAWLAARLFEHTKREHVELWLDYREKCPAIQEVMPDQVALDSPEAQRIKAHFREDQEWQRRMEERLARNRYSGPPAAERVRIVLERCLGGEPGLFGALQRQLEFEDDEEHGIGLLPESIQDHPGWKAADALTRQEIVEAARRYLREGEIDPVGLSQREERYVADRAPALAVQLLLGEDSPYLSELDAKRWALIGPFLLWAGAGSEDARRRSCELAYARAPGPMRDAAIKTVTGSTDAHATASVVAALEKCLDGDLGGRILKFLGTGDCGAEQFRELLGWLLRHGTSGARDFAAGLVKKPLDATKHWPRHCCEAAIALVAWGGGSGWDVSWPLIEKEDEVGKRVLCYIAHYCERQRGNVAEKLSEAQLGQVLGWLLTRYPPASDPERPRVSWLGPDDSLRGWRGELIRELRDRGTVAACQAVGGLRDAHPECPWLRNVYLETRSMRRRQSWVPPKPQDILQLVRDANSRMIETPSQLVDVIIESLDRFAEELHGTTPSAPNLWDKLPGDSWRPKNENHLSDNIKRHLEQDLSPRGVVVSREVQIRPRTGKDGAPGQHTDICVNAVPVGQDSTVVDNLTVIVEVKGCWNREVKDAHRTQLRERYLHENQCKHGIYLVGWFGCDQWDSRDDRNGHTPWRSFAEAKDDLRARVPEMRAEGGVRAYVLDCALR